jgi:histidine triad (HIT) family protein
MEDCIFCKIVAGETEGTFVYRDDKVAAFMDIQPMNPGHVLVIPVVHATHLAELPEETGAQMFRVAQRIAAAIYPSGLRCEGINFVLADGHAATQEVPHVHLHVIPRFTGDGIGVRFLGRRGTGPGRSELEFAAGRIRAQLEKKQPA